MEYLFCFAVPFLLLLIYPFFLFRAGLRAFSMSRQVQGEYAFTLKFIGLNLCEPLVNTILVSALLWGLPGYYASRNSEQLRILFALSPMLVLLLPAFGLRFRDPLYRSISMTVLLFGVARWGVNLLIFFSILGFQIYTTLNVLFIPGAFILLWLSTRWCKKQLDYALALPLPPPLPPPLPRMPKVVPAYAVARPAAPAAIMVVAPTVPLDAARAIRCPICHAPTMLEWDDCPACGLLFASRVPHSLRALPDFAVLRPLGDGGMSSVYLARTQATEQLCVIKTLVSMDAQADPTWHAAAAECLRREAALLEQIDNPRVARLRDHLSTASGDFLVLEYITGPTLEQFLTRATAHGVVVPGAALAHTEAISYARDIALTLEYLANLPQPVVHCDIKPANLILPTHAAAPVLVDFGGAQINQSTNQTARLDRYGTPGYAAPEQYGGNALPQSDVYGLAATLYHLLTDDDPGAHPLHFPALATLPADLSALLGTALDHDPAARPTAHQFERALALYGE